MEGRIRTFITVWMLLAASLAMRGQTFVGGCLKAGMPTTEYSAIGDYVLGVEGRIGIHRYCNIWPFAMISYDRLSVDASRPDFLPRYQDVVQAMGGLRWYPFGSTTFPLYGSVATGISYIPESDGASNVGLPGSLDVGFLLWYENPCCDWFLDVSLRYSALNMLRDLDRPHLSSLSLIIAIGLPIGGGH